MLFRKELPVTILFYLLSPLVLGFFESSFLEEWTVLFYPVHANIPIVFWTEVFTLIGTGALYCKKKMVEHSIDIDVFDKGKINKINIIKPFKDADTNGNVAHFYSLGYLGSEIKLISFFLTALMMQPVLFKLGLNLIFSNAPDYDPQIIALKEIICAAIYLSYSVYMVISIRKMNQNYVHSRQLSLDSYILVTGIILGWAEVYMCSLSTIRNVSEDYGAFSSSCPGYGKHHSGDVEAAFSKFISCSLSSKGCKHR